MPASASYPKDSEGVDFDPIIHQANKDSSPRRTNSGRYFRKAPQNIAAARSRAAMPPTKLPAVVPTTQPAAVNTQRNTTPVQPVAAAKAATPSLSRPTAAAVATIPATRNPAAPPKAPDTTPDDNGNDNLKRGLFAAACAAVAYLILKPLVRVAGA